jgi:hypothetical protein
MADFDLRLTRRSALVVMASLVPTRVAFAAQEPLITVHKDPNCGGCSGWVQHLQKAGFVTKVFDTNDIDAVKKRLGVPNNRLARDGGRQARKIRSSSVWSGWATNVHEFYRRRMSGSC